MPAPSLTRKSDGEWAAEGTRRSRVMWGIAAGLGSCGGIGDDGFTVADDDVLAGERL